MEKILAGKRAVVTGGSRGLGLAISRALAYDGARVLIVGRDADALEKGVSGIREVGGEASCRAADISRAEEAAGIIEQAVEDLGGLEILVNNAGVFIWKRFLDLDALDFERTLETNLHGPFHLSQAAARRMVAQGDGGSIINISSLHGLVADPNVVPHCASKAGLIALTRAMAEALRENDIRVNALCPGAIEESSADRRSDSPREKVTQADIASLVVYLASDLACSVTGAAIEMRGSTRVSIKT